MTKNEELIKLRVLKLIPEAWITASSLSAVYEEKYHDALSTQKITRILNEMHKDALIRKTKKRRSWGMISQYSSQEESVSEKPTPLK
ncbi:MAG: hypothetical protein M1529_01940 [Candidatus Thermoplasmatota archaeon]|jgi:DNA-binding PadR family transcriptional regulator|nr:hypothetical protein [Candidatus Thermoplasmatota archaeon]